MKNKKLLIIGGVGLVAFLVIVGIVAFLLTGNSRKASKMAKYLESNGFSCSDYGSTYECLDFDSETSIATRVFIEEGFTVSYEVESNNEYKFTIKDWYYSKSNRGGLSKAIEVEDRYYDETCFIVPESFEKSYDAFRDSNHWKVGDTSKQGNSCEYDFSKKTNEALRKFERIYKETGLEFPE